MSQAVIRNANKKYGEVHAADVNLQIRDKEFIVFVEHYVSRITGSVKG